VWCRRGALRTINEESYPSEQMMGRSPGRGGARVRHILGERLFRRLDEDVDIVRCEREVRIEFEQLVKQRGDLAAASVARPDPKRAQEHLAGVSSFFVPDNLPDARVLRDRLTLVAADAPKAARR
jgi:hypothetical protein